MTMKTALPMLVLVASLAWAAPAPAQEPLPPVVPEAESWTPLVDEEDLAIHVFETSCNSYLLTCKKTKRFVAVDPGPGMVARLKKHIADGHEFAAVWITHDHPDHISGLGEIRKEFEVPVIAHPAGKAAIASMCENWSQWGFSQMTPVVPVMPDTFVEDGATVKAGELSLTVLFAPGHSPGSICFLLGDRFLFCGDVLFKGSVGRTDFENADHEAFCKSLSDKLWDLPDGVVVFPGHGEKTTIGGEKKSNWLFQDYVRKAKGEEPIARPWMGIRLVEDRKEPGLELSQVTEGSPAAKAGLQPGDVLTVFDGVELREIPDIWKVIRVHEVGDTVKLTFLRAGEKKEVEFTFGARPPA